MLPVRALKQLRYSPLSPQACSYRSHHELPRAPADHGGYVPPHADLAERGSYNTRLREWKATICCCAFVLRRWYVCATIHPDLAT